MPTYEYRCKACGHELEVVQGFTDAALTKCPSCGKKELRKVFSAVGISFKGSGFYKNDSRSGSSSSSSSNGDAKSETKAETKTETKSETKSSDSASKASS